MGDEKVTTGVDALISMLESKQKVALSHAAKELGLSEDTVKLWVDFLVEEKILGIEYKFTKPYIYLNKTKKSASAQEELRLATFRKDFFDRAVESHIDSVHADELWAQHLQRHLDLIKPFFEREAKRRGLDNSDLLWDDFILGLGDGSA